MRLFYSQRYNIKFGNKENANSGESLLRHVLHGFCGVNEETEILRTKKGRPCIDEDGAPFFSISHTGNLWVCAVSERPAGIDVEALNRRIRSPERMAKRFLTADEQEFIRKAPVRTQETGAECGAPDRQNLLPANDSERCIFDPQLEEILPLRDTADWDAGRRLLLLWTRKEALLKYTGDGLRRLSDAGSVLGAAARGYASASPILRSFLCGDYLLSVCCAPEAGDEINCGKGIFVQHIQIMG